MPTSTPQDAFTPVVMESAAPLRPAVPAPVDPAANFGQPGQAEQDEPPLIPLDPLVRESPAWLLSAVLHMAALILLGLWLMSGEPIEYPLEFDAVWAEAEGEQLIEEPIDLDVEADLSLTEQMAVLEPLPPVEDPLAMPELMISPAGNLLASQSPATTIGVALTGREPGMRQQLLKAFGGTASTEAAVMAGLDWLARNQMSDGGWSLNGPYTNGARIENEEAATAMALLAFQGRGYTHKSDPHDRFTKAVIKGWRRLLRSQDEQGNFFREAPSYHRYYTQAQCAIALCELYGMTRDEAYREPAQRAIDYLVETQSDQGGWKYTPYGRSDLSVTGWVVMALQSARMAGLEVPSPTLDAVREFLDSVSIGEGSYRGSEYAYEVRQGPKISMTAEGLLCRQYLGWKRGDVRLGAGVEKILQNLPAWRTRRNVYYWYYATQVCHHMEGDAWNKWNGVMRQMLPENQVKRGRERGSWTPRGDRYEDAGGRLYVTCLSIYTLEVYYRHLPIYRKGLLDSP